MEIILASASPRRADLLRQIGVVDFWVCPAESETPLNPELPPQEGVLTIAQDKMHSVARGVSTDVLVLAADTMVCLDGVMLGKPKDETDAFVMLSRLGGAKHTVYTAVVMGYGGRESVRVCQTDVYFRNISPEEIAAYIATGDPLDKAGSYGLQGAAGAFIRRIDGDVYTVIGLPLYVLDEMAAELGTMIRTVDSGQLRSKA